MLSFIPNLIARAILILLNSQTKLQPAPNRMKTILDGFPMIKPETVQFAKRNSGHFIEENIIAETVGYWCVQYVPQIMIMFQDIQIRKLEFVSFAMLRDLKEKKK